MIKTYIRLAFRSLVKNKAFSFINIFGLATGLTCCMLISVYLMKEFSYDKQHRNGNRIYQLATINKEGGEVTRSATTASPMGPAMKNEFAEIEAQCRLLKTFQDDKTLLQYRGENDLRSFYENNGFFADADFFRLFTYDFSEGDPATALNSPTGLVISEDLAKKIFGKSAALNKVIHINSNTNGEFDFTVTGVFRKPKNPSHIDAGFFMSMQSGEVGPWVRESTSMVNNNLFYTYFLLRPGADPKKLEAKFDGFINKYAGDDLRSSGRSRGQYLINVKDIHLYSDAEGNVTPSGSLTYLYILLSIAVVTLLIACVNFMNLSTARSVKRAVEIGVRKVLGAQQHALVKQFLWEAILLSMIAFFIALALGYFLIPLFEKLSGREFSFTGREYALVAFGFFIITIIAGLLAGIYPAFYLSAFKPVKVLKGKFTNSFGAISFRKVLVVFQFVIAVGLIVASISIGKQMHYMRTKDLGFVKDQQLVIPLRTTASRHIFPALKEAVLSNAAVSSAGASIYYPGVENVTDWLLYKQGNPSTDTKTVFINRVDNSYMQTLGLKLAAGRLFSPAFPNDTANRIVLNEQAIRQFGFRSPEDAIGKNLAATRNGAELPFEVVGVVKDFHFKGLHSAIESYGFLLNRTNSFAFLLAHIQPGQVKQAISGIGANWKKLNPNEPFEYSFLNHDFNNNYIEEERLAAIIRYFTIIAILISCLGLFGLTTFTVEQRTKEIGIRKVLGASVAGVVALLSKDFLKLVFISFLIASPLAWYFIHRWLESFAYRVSFSFWIVFTGWVLAFLIAFFTISIQAVKLALTNPVKNLRTE